MQQVCFSAVCMAKMFCRWPRRTRRPLLPAVEYPCLFPPSTMRRQTKRYVRQVRYVHAGKVVTRTMTETTEVKTHAGYDRAGGAQWASRAVHRELDACRYVDDFKVRRFVIGHPDGASLDEIAEGMNLSKEGVAGCERRAVKKLLLLALEDEEVFRWATETLGINHDFAEAFMRRRTGT